jgi:hypothetical protein
MSAQAAPGRSYRFVKIYLPASCGRSPTVRLSSPQAAQLAQPLDISRLHAKLDQLAQTYCPVMTTLDLAYSWSTMQAEYATDLVFTQPATLPAFYPPIRTRDIIKQHCNYSA